jgi:hypothetical protein
MITVFKNTINQFVITGRERSLIYASGGTPFYVMDLHNQQTKANINLIVPILSSCSRFDLCKMIVSGTNQNLSAGTINLTETGQYDYYLYEKSNQTTGLTNTNLLEIGILNLTGNTSNSKPAFNTNKNYVIYNG